MGDLTANLSRSEFACGCGCGYDTVDVALPMVLQKCVYHFQAKHPGMKIGILINSGTRCRTYNKKVSGSKKSQHLIAKAADIIIYDKLSQKDISSDDVSGYFRTAYPDSHGVGRYKGRTHIDVCATKARWDLR